MSKTQPEVQAAPKKKKHTVRNVLLGIAALIVLIIIISSASHGSSSPAATSSSAPAAAAPATSAAPAAAAAPTTAAPAAPAAPKVIYQKSGSGIMTTPNFTTPAEWQVKWSYDCTSFAGGTGNFVVNSEDFQANVNELGAKGADSTYVHNDAGTHSLSINSECTWTVTVLG